MDRQELKTTLTGLLEETTGETYPEVGEDQSLTDGLGLDSIDALELAVEISRRYKVQIKSDDERNREIFRSVRTLAAFIAEEGRTGIIVVTLGNVVVGGTKPGRATKLAVVR